VAASIFAFAAVGHALTRCIQPLTTPQQLQGYTKPQKRLNNCQKTARQSFLNLKDTGAEQE